jgi:hypothetical protein
LTFFGVEAEEIGYNVGHFYVLKRKNDLGLIESVVFDLKEEISN